MKLFFKILFLGSATFGFTESPKKEKDEVSQIRIHNCVLAHVGEKTISTFDLKQHLDLLFYANFPQYADNPAAKMQFYEAQWKMVLDEMVNTQLMILDAEEKQVETSDGEVHQEMHERYGPSVAKNLAKAGVSYSSAFESIKNELTVRKMTGHMVHAKAFQELTPIKLQKAYQKMLRENPATTTLKYQTLTVDGEKNLDEAYAMLQDAGIEALPKIIVALKTDDTDARLSEIYETEESKLAKPHKAILDTLQSNSFSKPVEQITRRGDKLVRIFILHDKVEKLPPAFQDVEKDLTNEILNSEVVEGTRAYAERLRKKHAITLSVPENFVPFQM